MLAKVDNNIKVNCTIDGTIYQVSTIELRLQTNSIPYITLTIAPFTDKVVKPTLESFMASTIQKALQSAAENSKLCNLKVELKESGVTLDLKEWVVKQAGVAVKDVFNSDGIPVTIYHPAVALTQIHFGCFGVVKSDVSDKLSSSKFNQAIKDTLTNYIKRIDTTVVDESYISSLEKAKRDLERGIQLFDKYIAADVQFKESFKNNFEDTSAPFAWILSSAYSVTNVSLWDWLIMIAKEYHLQVIADSTDLNQPLILTALEPWGDSTLDITDSKISKISAPSTMATNISGVATIRPTVINTTAIMSSNSKGKKKELSTRLLCYPTQSNNSNTAGYNYKELIMAAWLITAYAADNSRNTILNTNKALKQAAGPGKTLSILEVAFELQTVPSEIWVKELFYLHHRYNYRCSVTCHPAAALIAGNISTPGVVASVKASSSELFRFYTDKITHIFSVPQRLLYSNIEGSYYRDSFTSKPIISLGAQGVHKTQLYTVE